MYKEKSRRKYLDIFQYKWNNFMIDLKVNAWTFQYLNIMMHTECSKRITCASNEDIVRIKEILIDRAKKKYRNIDIRI